MSRGNRRFTCELQRFLVAISAMAALLGSGFFVGGLVYTVLLAGPANAAQPPVQATNPAQPSQSNTSVQVEDKSDKLPEIDDRSPLPPSGDRKQQVLAKLPVPNPDRAIFAGRKDGRGNLIPGSGIVDFEEIASAKKNSDEYLAWHELVLHAKSLSQADLDEFASRELTRDDLIGMGPSPRLYRLKLVRFDGTVTRIRRVLATRSLEDVGTKEVFEAEMVPFDEPPTDRISVVFTELPEALAAIAQQPLEQWQEVNREAIAAGFFFKVRQDPHQTDKFPVLIGKSLTLRDTTPQSALAANATSAIPLDARLQVYRGIKDDARIAKGDENWQEAVAWNRMLLHARRFSPEALEENARDDLQFAQLLESERKDYQFQLVKFEGRLLMVRKMEPSQKLRAAGITTAYEGWLSPKDEPRGNPVCIVFTDPLPEGVGLGRVNKWVTFAGYSFKLLQYESGEFRQDDPTRHVFKRAPLLLGRAIILRPDPDAPSTVSWNSFVKIATGVVSGLLVIAGGITWWFRRGDRRARAEINTHRARNPFQAQTSGETAQY